MKKQPTTSTSSAQPAVFELPRFVWANTTIRQPLKVLGRLTALVEAIPLLTVDSYPSAESWKTEVGRRLVGGSSDTQIRPEVVDKTILLCEHLGLVERLEPRAGGRWLKVHPAAEALLTDPDPVAMFAWLLIQDVFADSAIKPHRHNLALLNFLQACERVGVEAVRTDHIAYFMASKQKENKWHHEATALRAYLCDVADRSVEVNQWLELGDPSRGFRVRVSAAAKELCEIGYETYAEAHLAILAQGTRLIPNARGASLTRIADLIAGHVVAGDVARVECAILSAVLEAKVSSQCDLVATALGYLAAAELVELTPETAGEGKTAKAFRLTAFGREVVSCCLPRPESAAVGRVYQRSCTGTPFVSRGVERSVRFDAYLSGIDIKSASEALDWHLYEGKGIPHKFEWAVVKSIFRSVVPHKDHRLIDGVRTLVGPDFEAHAHAPGRGADGWLRASNGTYVLIEASGEAGRRLISHELEPIVRHSLGFAEAHPSDRVITICVAPSFESRFVGYLLNDARPADGETRAVVLPLTTTQLKRLVGAARPINELLESLYDRLTNEALSHGDSGGLQALHLIEEMVLEFSTTSRRSGCVL